MLKRSWIIILFYGDQNGTLNNHCLDGIKSNIYVFILSIMLKHYVLILSKILLKIMLSASKWPQIHRCYYNLLLLIHRFQITCSHILNSTNSPLHYIINISHLFKWLHIIVHRATESKFKWSQSVSCSVVSNSFDLMDYSSPGSSVHGIFQARIREWVVIPFSRGSLQPGDWTRVSCNAGGFFTAWTLLLILDIYLEVKLHWVIKRFLCSSYSFHARIPWHSQSQWPF